MEGDSFLDLIKQWKCGAILVGNIKSLLHVVPVQAISPAKLLFEQLLGITDW